MKLNHCEKYNQELGSFINNETIDKMPPKKIVLSQAIETIKNSDFGLYSNQLQAATADFGPLDKLLYRDIFNATYDNEGKRSEDIGQSFALACKRALVQRLGIFYSDEGKPNLNQNTLVDFLLVIMNFLGVSEDSDALLIYSFKKGKYIDAHDSIARIMALLLNDFDHNLWGIGRENAIIELLKRKAKQASMKDFSKDYFGFSGQDLSLTDLSLVPHNPDHMVLLQSPIEPKEMATPQFDQFLRSTFDDQAERDFVQEWAGYLLDLNNTGTVILFAISSGASGKSTLFNVYRDMLGATNVSGLKVQNLSKQFAKQGLMDKLAILADENDADGFPTSELKAISGYSPITIDRKFKDSIETVLRLKMAFAFNTLPAPEDTVGFSRRLIILPFEHTFLAKSADKQLGEKLVAELPGIAWLAIKKLKELRQNDYAFSQSANMAETKAEYFATKETPVATFMRQQLHIVSGQTLTRADIIQDFEIWLKASNVASEGYTKGQRFWNEFRRCFPIIFEGVNYSEHKSNGYQVVDDIGFRADGVDSALNLK